MWWMLTSFLQGFYEYVYIPFILFFTSSENSSPYDILHIKFEHFPHWLESNIRLNLHEELLEFIEVFDSFNKQILILQQASVALRSHVTTGTITTYSMITKINKIYDLIQLLQIYNIMNSLPDKKILSDYIHTISLQLKAIDEIVFSKKAEFSGGKNHKPGKHANNSKNINHSSLLTGQSNPHSISNNEILNIRTAVRKASKQLNEIEKSMKKEEALLSYFAEIKSLVNYPLQECAMKIRSLPILSEMRSSLDEEYNLLKKVDEQYSIARKSEVLVEAAILRSEAGLLENIAEHSLEGIRGIFHDDIIAAVQMNISDTNDSSDDTTIAAEVLIEWYGELLGYMRLPLIELLKGCTREFTAKSFRNAIQRLQELIITSPSTLTELVPISFIIIEQVKNFDINLFIAYAEDWNERMHSFERLIKKKSFLEAYEKLNHCRIAVDKARIQYENEVLRFNQAIADHKEVNKQLRHLREVFIELALTECAQEVEFLP